MNKIQKVSSYMRLLMCACIFGFPFLTALFWANANYFFFHRHNVFFSQVERFNQLTTPNILLGFLVDFLLKDLMLIYIFYCLFKLFNLYKQGEIFSFQNVKYLRNIGYALLLAQILGLFHQALMSFVLTFNNPAGYRVIKLGLNQYNFYAIFTALTIIIISWVMAEGCKLKEEQQLTV